MYTIGQKCKAKIHFQYILIGISKPMIITSTGQKFLANYQVRLICLPAEMEIVKYCI
jgi:hypothetical protein